MKNILIIGQCTLHWGRMEFGNIGNYYIIEPFVRELHRVFPDCSIETTFQMTDEFCANENVTCLPMDLYYGWSEEDVPNAFKDLGIAHVYADVGILPETTPYIDAVMKSDLVIDFSGDIWGDNANLVGPDRFRVGLIKDRVAQLLKKPTVMLAGSPGPFKDQESVGFAKEVFKNFNFVTTREELSPGLLEQEGFDVSNVTSLACPAFLFESKSDEEMSAVYAEEGLVSKNKPSVGFILCGWNMEEKPYDKWPREDAEYTHFIQAAEYMIRELGVHLYLMSHSNGFLLPPDFELIHGRDFPFAEQLYKMLSERGLESDVTLIRGIYTPAETKAIIRQFDLLVSGRVHAAVAALAQCVPTVIIDYGHEPKAHKLKGFAAVADVVEYVADPAEPEDLIKKIQDAWSSRKAITKRLQRQIPRVCALARENFDRLTALVE